MGKKFCKNGLVWDWSFKTVGAIIEAKYEKEIMKWPKSIAPFEVVIIPSISKNNKENLLKAEKIYNELKNKMLTYC